MATEAREPPRDQGKGEAWLADGDDGGGERERFQVRAVLHLPGLEGSLGGECQLLPRKWPRGERGLGGREPGRKAVFPRKVVSKGGILPS